MKCLDIDNNIVESNLQDVHNLIEEIVAEKGNMSKEDAVAYVKKMEQQKRYSADVWS